MMNIGKFLKDVTREMRKVSWPKRKELTRYTITVVATVAFVAIFFAVVDLGISQILELIRK
ncbi:preprotein translocase subunit SecE [Salirhabdus salicampi]|uniref:preprotein translocase subunit SecE n=1 Tax=Salirhabdus salicampi TaxID=476102 RepID=UPI0020C31635|nr:preprotein translocase subunit SecE [Salirhabdus salicampi]MCP8618061.1 preprotein translocase subunit SecE [Salirhabdus salicampi]